MSASMNIALYALLLLIIVAELNGSLTTRPSNRAVTVGDRVLFNCSTDIFEKTVNWLFRPQNKGSYNAIAYGDKVDSQSVGKYEAFSPSQGSYVLVIPEVTINDTGEYKCIDDEGFGAGAVAHLTVSERILGQSDSDFSSRQNDDQNAAVAKSQSSGDNYNSRSSGADSSTQTAVSIQRLFISASLLAYFLRSNLL